MEEFIKIEGSSFLLNTDMLGLNEAQLWIGGAPDGPKDNEDERVLNERVKAKTENNPGSRISGIEALNLRESKRHLGWFEIEVISWKPGVYRLMIHSRAYVPAPKGTPIRSGRDLQYSWPVFSDDYLRNMPYKLQKFLYLEPNGTGFCIRIEVTESHQIRPAGNGPEWIR